MRKHQTKKALILMLVEVITATGLGVFVLSAVNAPAAQAQVGFFGVGGILAPALLPPAGDGDVLNIALSCSPEVTIVGPDGANWGTYQWGVSIPYDYWEQSYLTNGYPYTHAGEYMLGTAVFPNPNYTCPLPLLLSIGTSLFKTAP